MRDRLAEQTEKPLTANKRHFGKVLALEGTDESMKSTNLPAQARWALTHVDEREDGQRLVPFINPITPTLCHSFSKLIERYT
jgi:hypothetical protein